MEALPDIHHSLPAPPLELLPAPHQTGEQDQG
jgi:hypothetical protein